MSTRRATGTSRPVPEPLAVSDGHTIKVVAERTGLEMGTLRAWERRYGFPRPGRRKGSNRRLYSNADLARLLAMKRLLDRGYRVGDVVQKALPELEELAGAGPDPVNKPTLDPEASAVADLMALVAADRVNEIELRLRQSAAALGPRRFVTDLVHPFAVSVGRAWAAGLLSIRQEHLATECLITQLRQMLAGYQDIQATPLVLLATLPGEVHTLPLQMVALYLVLAGAKPRLLGGPTPPEQIADSARILRADAVGIGVTVTRHNAHVRKDLVSLRSALDPKIQLWVGGSGAAGLESSHEATTIVECGYTQGMAPGD
jgi:MerR family transcriptional regulator, light-induced transcriptional regulator